MRRRTATRTSICRILHMHDFKCLMHLQVTQRGSTDSHNAYLQGAWVFMTWF